MRGRLPLPPIPGQAVGGGVPDAPETLRQRPSPGQSPAEGSRPLPTDRTIDGCSRQPPGRACPAPTVRRPGNGCLRKPRSVSISPSVGRGAPTPPRPSAAANNNPCLPPWGKVAPQGRMRGRLPLPPIPGQTVGGGVPDTPRRLALAPFPGLLPAKPSANGHPPGNHPQTSAHANPRAGHARPLPGNNPTHLYTTQKGGSHT